MGQTIEGSAVYGVVEDPNRTAGFFRTTGNANVAANINYSDKWIANYNYVENSSNAYNPTASYSQLDVKSSSLAGLQIAIKGYSKYISTTGNNGISVGGYFAGDGWKTQDSYGVMAEAISTGANNIGGRFVADSTGIDENSYGVFASSRKKIDGVGVVGLGNNITTYYVPTGKAGSGGVFQGKRYGVYACQDSIGNGEGYGFGQTYTGLLADATSFSNNAYHFGVHGKSFGNFRRTGGVLGTSGHSTLTWGSLGYISSGGANYGGYGTATTWTAANGKSISYKTGVAFGGCGDLFGSWFREEVYGMAVKGDRYGLYVDGKQYTNDIITIVTPSASKSTKTATYVQTSMSVDVYAKGTGTLTNGNANIKFDPSFCEIISSDEEVIVTITPIGRSANLYIERSNAQGFLVREDQGNTIARQVPVKFTWIAIGTKKGYENPQNPTEVMQKDYDAKLSGFMFNENNTEQSGTPMWWDGNITRYDAIPVDHFENGASVQELKRTMETKQMERPKPMKHKKEEEQDIEY